MTKKRRKQIPGSIYVIARNSTNRITLLIEPKRISVERWGDRSCLSIKSMTHGPSGIGKERVGHPAQCLYWLVWESRSGGRYMAPGSFSSGNEKVGLWAKWLQSR